MSGPSVLVVDDEPAIRRLLRTGLGSQGYAIREAADAAEALAAIAEAAPDLVVLDLGLPGMGGIEFLSHVRARLPELPVIILSSRDDEAGKVEALDLGADDYVTKPFGMAELLARMRNALRHRLQTGGAQPVFRAGDLTVDLVHRTVRRGKADLHLTPKEYAILRALVRHAGKVLTHAHLIREVWGHAVDPQYLRIYVRQLRQKIEPNPEQPTLIVTETGVGYRLKAAALADANR